MKRWWVIAALLVVSVAVPGVACAASSVDASPVVSVAGSVVEATVEGTVTLSAKSVQALAAAFASAVPTPSLSATVTLGPEYARLRDVAYYAVLICTFLLSTLVMYLMVVA